MLNLRAYEEADAQEIVNWSTDEVSFHKWCADTFNHFPITAEEFNSYYNSPECNAYIKMTVTDNHKPIGHYFLCFTDECKKTIRFCFVINNPSQRGKGYGKQMMKLAIQNIYDNFNIDKITLGVFENNPTAYYCYKSVGFQDVKLEKDKFYHVMGEDWKCLEMAIERVGNSYETQC